MTQVATPPQPLKPSAEGEGWKARPIKLKIFGNLISEVVHKGICMYCGACIASCPIDILFHSESGADHAWHLCCLPGLLLQLSTHRTSRCRGRASGLRQRTDP